VKKIWSCRRTFICFFGISCITAIGFVTKDAGVAMAISGVAIGLGAANAYEKKSK